MANPGRLNAQQHLFTVGLRIWVLPRFQRLSPFDDLHRPHDRILRLKRRVVPLDETAEFAWITRLAKETGRPVWFLLTDRPTDPERWRRIMAGVHQARAAGASVTAQVAGRPVGVILGIWSAYSPRTAPRRPAPRSGRKSIKGLTRRRTQPRTRTFSSSKPSPAYCRSTGGARLKARCASSAPIVPSCSSRVKVRPA